MTVGQIGLSVFGGPSPVDSYLGARNQALDYKAKQATMDRNAVVQGREDTQYAQQQNMQAIDQLGAIVDKIPDGDTAAFGQAVQFAVQNKLIDPNEAAKYTVNDLPRIRALSAQARQMAKERAATEMQGKEWGLKERAANLDQAQFGETRRHNMASEANDARRGGAGGGRPLSGGIVSKVQDAGSMLQSMAEFSDTFQSKYGGGAETLVGGELGNTLQSYVPGIAKAITNTTGLDTSSPESADWWRRYQDFKNEVRHGRFGGALTPTEKAQFDKQSIDPGMRPEAIQRALQNQARVVKSATARLRGMLVNSGYDQSAIDAGLGIEGEGAYQPGTGAGTGMKAAPLPPDPKALKMGTIYETNQGPARYIGNGQFEGME